VDRVDWRILAELQADGRLSMNALARRVNLSAPSVGERVRRLQDDGVLTGYHAVVDPVKAGRGVRAIVRMHCYGPTCLLRDPAVREWPQLLQMYRVTGDDCSVLVVAVEDMPAFEALLDRLAAYGQPTSSLVLDDVVAWRPVEQP
jgi:Lrp/AsnC family transcriptional regulator, leucine-responsive regulatory protein